MDSSKTVWMIFLEIHEFKPRKIPFSAMNVYVFSFRFLSGKKEFLYLCLTNLLILEITMKKEDNTEQLILQAAEMEFLEKGFALAKTTEIAKKAGVTHAMLHYYFRTKENLFEQVFRQKVYLIAEALDTVFDSKLSFKQQLSDLIRTHFEFLCANPRLPLFLLNEIFLDEKRRGVCFSILIPVLRRVYINLTAALEEAVRQGEVRSVQASDLMISIFSLNIMPIIGQPIMQSILNLDHDAMSQFIAHRMEENLETIWSRLKI